MRIERTRGDTIPDVFTVTSPVTKDVVNLTGCTFKLTLSSVKEPPDITTQLYQLVGDVPDPTTGVVRFTPTTSQADLVGYYYFDIQMIDSFSQVVTLTSGDYIYRQDITK